MMHLLCRVFGHRRSKRRAWAHAGVWRSDCLICGGRVERVAPGKWRTVAVPEPVMRVARGPLPGLLGEVDQPRDISRFLPEASDSTRLEGNLFSWRSAQKDYEHARRRSEFTRRTPASGTMSNN